MTTAPIIHRDWADRRCVILTGPANMPPGMIEIEIIEGPDKGGTHWVYPDWVKPE